MVRELSNNISDSVTKSVVHFSVEFGTFQRRKIERLLWAQP